eukprot:GHVP01029027.1.p2 GENE.GHVP01029027.1~~GHVP01029027.1.p2  ORF type:complete len:217 (+),score=51.36 GHVP01029027.1:810-1460(+)
MKKFPSSVDPNFPSASKSSFEPSKENKDSMKEPWKFATPRTPPPPPVAGFEKHAAEQIQEDLEEVPHSNVKIVPWPELPAIAFEAALDPIAANSNALDLAENEEKKKNASPMKPLYDPVCTRNYDKTCPVGWDQLGKHQCKATEYPGPCPSVLQITTTKKDSAFEKSQLAQICKIMWPCENDLCEKGRNYNVQCPTHWTSEEREGIGVCVPPSSYR